MADQSIDKTVRMTEVIKILLDNAPVVNTEKERIGNLTGIELKETVSPELGGNNNYCGCLKTKRRYFNM